MTCNLCAGPCECGAEAWREQARLAKALLVELPPEDPGEDFDPDYGFIDHPGRGWDANGSPA